MNFRLTRTIEKNLPTYICNQFFNTQQLSLRKLFKKEKIRMDKKLNWCSSNKHRYDFNSNISNIMKINYIDHGHSDEGLMSHNEFAVSLHGSNNAIPNDGYSVDLDPSKYNCTPGKLLEPREKWFINTTNIPNEVIGLLQLGEGFCLPPDNKSSLITEFIKHFDGFLRLKGQLSCVNTMRNQFINFLKTDT